jgi:nucleotide-binding universal stress UspA family protein
MPAPACALSSCLPVADGKERRREEDERLVQDILIPTDGSELAAKAIEHGVLFAREIGAKVTAVAVTEPFHVLAVAPSQIEYTASEYKKHAEADAAKALGVASAAAERAGVACETMHVEHPHIYQAIIVPLPRRGAT